ncbi:Carnitine monooxygenase oxygenase subunit [Nymphon striatum]|nr:Carnitine monooxygenase oxygenase subunit [Nymphon striatum]
MFGVAISSSSPAVAARCSYTRAGVGAVASQNITDPSLGPMCLDLMQSGKSAEAAVAEVKAKGQHIDYRQVLAIDAQGNTAIHSGPNSLGIWTDAAGKDVLSAGNLLANETIPQAIVDGFQSATGHLGDRLIAAMRAGLDAGGEAGPIHSAGLQICSQETGWHCVGRVDEVSENGDFFTLQLLNEPLIIVRDQSGIKALSNVCRHRGMRLAEGAGNTKRFVCRYHAWMYSTDGMLQRAARMKNEGFDPKNCKLGEFHCEERFGFIYVCLSEAAPDIDKELEGLGTLINSYEPENYRIVHSATEIWQTNWKCLVENFMEGYHLSVVHPETLHGYTPTGLSKKSASGEGFTSYEANYPQDIPARGQGAPNLTAEERHRQISATAIEVKWTMSAYGDELNNEAVNQRIALWEEVNREDREKLEIMQTSFASVHATGGPLAGPDYEGTVHDVLLWLARQDALTGDNLSQLEYLVAVGESGTIALASERVNVSSPSISAAISQLEAEFGIQIFVRHHAQGLSLTPGGRRIFQ